MKVSPHNHCESPLSGSTIANMVARAKELGREYFAYTDQGHLSSCLKAYNLSKKAGLKFIPGIEIFFKDPSCPITAGTSVDRCRYFNLTVYAEDQDAYQELCKLVSQEMPTIELYEEVQPLWSWTDLERIAKFNANVVLGGVHDLVGKTMLSGHADLAEMIISHLKSMFKDRLYVSLVCEPFSKKWNSIVEIKYQDGTHDSCLSNDMVSTDKARKIKAIDLVDHHHHGFVKAIYSNHTFKEVNLPLDKAVLHKGFLPLPGGDAMQKVNRFLKIMANKHGIPILVSDYAFYANKEDKIVQTMRLEGNTRLHSNFYMKSEEEIIAYLQNTLSLSESDIQGIINNNSLWSGRFDKLELRYEWRLSEPEEGSVQRMMDIIKSVGRMQWDNPEWVARLKREIDVIVKNPKKNLLPYFLPISDVLNHYKANGQLTGPARGSAGGSLLCYVMGITHIDPMRYGLSFSRFFSLARIMSNKLTDIDIDLPGRTLLVGEDGHSGYLYNRWGNRAAQISTRTTIRLKSAIKDTNRYLKGKVEPEIEALTKGLPAPPQGISDLDFVFGFEDEEGNHNPGLIEYSDKLQEYAEKRPDEWAIVSKAMGISKAFSRHASAFGLSDIPISDVLPTKDGNITQYEAKEVESAGLIKYDFLVINQLKDIQFCLELINKRNGQDQEVGHFIHQGQKLYIWDIPSVPEVFKSIWGGDTEACFQINTRSMTPFVKDILPQSIEDLSTILALVRPGPMDFIDPRTGKTMAEEYVLRRQGAGNSDIPELDKLIPETYSVMVFQEQITKIAKELAGFNGEDAEKLRENLAKKRKVESMKMKPLFIEGASRKVSPEVAEELWNRMETFSRYGFNKSHSIGYAHITYACMFLKYFYPLEWWAAILNNATEQEITGKLWPYVKDMVMPPDINLSTDTMVPDYSNNKIRSKLGMIRGVGDATIEPIVAGRPYKDIQDFVNKEVSGPSIAHRLIFVGVLDSLFPPKANLKEKLKLYQDAVENKKYKDKVEKAAQEGRIVRASQPKEGVIPEGYADLHPMEEAALKKSILPSMPLDLHSLGSQYSKALTAFHLYPEVIDSGDHRTKLIDSEQLRRLDETPAELVQKDIYVAATCYIIKAEEFSYQKGAKRALKLIVDSGTYTSEKVLWPDYNTGQLVYPLALKRGVIATIFMKKKAERKDMSITSIVIETKEKS